MHGLIQGIKRHAGQMDGMMGQTRCGVVSAIDPVRALVRVTLQPDGVTTGWMPYATPMQGVHMAPIMGAQAIVQPREGDAGNGIVTGFIYSIVDVPPSVANALAGGPVPAQSGELIFQSLGGGIARFCADGSILLVGIVNIQGVTNVLGDVHVTGDLTVSGEITDRGRTGATASLSKLRDAYDAHVHPGVQAGLSNTQTTNLPV